MHYLRRQLSFLSIISSLLFAVLIPGGSLILAQKYKAGFSIPFIGLFWVWVLSWGRVVIEPSGFVVMLTGLISLHIISYFCGVILSARNRQPLSFFKITCSLILLVIINSAIITSCHTYKDKWFGFAFYHIPSNSMAPTLQAGDVILADTWVYKHQLPQNSDIVIIKQSANSMVLAKRLEDKRIKNGKTEFFIVGDNQNNSVDSRRFGWITNDFLMGKAKSAVFSFTNSNRYLLSIK